MNNIVIVGCNFSGLYSAMKCVDNGISVIIIEKNSACSEEIINYKIFNKHHTYYINFAFSSNNLVLIFLNFPYIYRDDYATNG